MKPKNTKKSLALVNDRFTRARDFRTTQQDEVWKRSYNNWRGVLDTSLYPWRSKLFIPWSFTVVETIIPKVFARDPKWRAIAQSPDFPEDGPTVVNDLLTYQWKHMGMRLKMYDYIKDSLMYSKGYAKVGWNFQTKTGTYMEPQVDKNDVITFKEIKKSKVAHDDPMVDIVDPMDIYVDPDATCLDDAAYLIHRKTMTLDEIKDNPNYSNTDKIESKDYADAYMDKLSRYRDVVPPKDKHKDLVEVLEYWEEDRLLVIANRGTVLRDTPNPYDHKKIPFVELDDYRDPHRYYGQSELSVIDPLQREINAIRNQRRDYDNLALNPVIRMVPGVLRNPNAAVMAPGSVWMVSDLNSMDVFELPQLQGNSTEIEERTIQDLQRTVAIDEIGIGLLPDNPQRRSATEVVTATTMAGKRFAMKIALLEEAVKKIGSLVFALDQQFLDQERLIQVVGKEGAAQWVRFDSQDIQGDYYVDIEAGSMLPQDEVAVRQEAMQLLQYITPILAPLLQSNPGVALPIIKLVVGTFEFPSGDKDAIIKELEGALGQAQQAQQQAAMAEQQLLQSQQAQAEAQALSTISTPVAQTPQTAQGKRSDLEAQQALKAK